MSENIYNFGYYLVMALPVIIMVLCVYRIRKNKMELKKLETKEKPKDNDN